MTTTLWIKEIPQPELTLLHHALRMLKIHPHVTKDDVEGLADVLWQEICERADTERTQNDTMSHATRTLRDAVVILRDPYNRDPADVQATADALDRIAGAAEEFDLEALLTAEAEIGATPTEAQTLSRRMIPEVLRTMGFGRQEVRR